jgi:diguanylate cyclase (GGDEF)-like protein
MKQERMNFQDQALEAHRDKNDFLANMRHELRTPVNAIIGYSEMLLEDAKDTDHKDFIFDLQNIHKAGKQVLSLINQVLDSSKIEASKADIDLESFRVNIHYELRTPLNIIIGYSEMLLEDAEKNGQEDFISDLRKIYKAGMNLLDLIKDILKGSNFENVTVTSDPETSTRSTAIQDMPHIIHSHKEDNANTMESGKAFLLVVDDNEMNRDMLSRRLKRQGYMVAVAEDGYQALKMIKAQQFDLVLLDIMMPGMDGYEVCRRIKSEPQTSGIPIIFITSMSEIQNKTKGFELGAVDYITKPFDVMEVKARVKTHLSLALANKKLHQLAETDFLTNIYNRRIFLRFLEAEINKARRYSNAFSLIMFDIDHFKAVNDTYGHDVGDYVLKTTVDIIKKDIRRTDVFVRYGGEEFIIMLPEIAIEGAKLCAENTRATIEQNNFDKVKKITISVGVTMFKENDTINSITKRVDEALYRAKDNGRNRVEVA